MVQYKKLIYENQQVPSQGVLRTTENIVLNTFPPKKINMDLHFWDIL